MNAALETIDFNQNWNNKLHNNAFSAIRLRNPRKYAVGKTYNVTLKGQYMGEVLIVDSKEFKIYQLNNFMCYLDTGYPHEKVVDLLKTMYKNRVMDINGAIFSFLLLVKTKENPTLL